MTNKRRNCYTPSVDEGRKRVILIAASILAARKLASYDPGKRVPATICAITDAVKWAEAIRRNGREHKSRRGSRAGRCISISGWAVAQSMASLSPQDRTGI